MPPLIARYRSGLLASVERLVRAPIEPADIVQETWARALPAIEAGRVENIGGYLHGVARNLSAEAMRQQHRWSRWLTAPRPHDDAADDTPSIERVVAARDEVAALLAALDALPLRTREIFAARHFEGLDKAAIAARHDIGVKQVERLLRQALILCTRVLSEDGARD